MIDWAQVKQLEEDVGAEDLSEVVELFLSEVDEAVGTLLSDPPTEAPDIARQMHFLKGCASNLGFRGLADYCAKGETAANGGDTSSITMEEVQAIYAASKAEFLRDFADNSSAQLQVA